MGYSVIKLKYNQIMVINNILHVLPGMPWYVYVLPSYIRPVVDSNEIDLFILFFPLLFFNN